MIMVIREPASQMIIFVYLFSEKHQRGNPNNNSPTNNISILINEDLQSWLNDDNIITEAAFPDNFRCIISGPSECGKIIIGPTVDQYKGLERINDGKAWSKTHNSIIEFIKDIIDLPSPDKLPKDLKKLIIFDDV